MPSFIRRSVRVISSDLKSEVSAVHTQESHTGSATTQQAIKAVHVIIKHMGIVDIRETYTEKITAYRFIGCNNHTKNKAGAQSKEYSNCKKN